MKEIKLTQGLFTKVDDCDFDWLNKWKWYAHRGHSKRSLVKKYYAARRDVSNNYKLILMHNIILPCGKNKENDHLDGDSLNNQRNNLRNCTHKENMKNMKLSKISRRMISEALNIK
jgi:hypothetical protein